MIQDEGSTLKLFAGIISTIVLAAAYFILKSDPIRETSPQRQVAVQQVKDFAQFIGSRPEMARVEPKPVYQMVMNRMKEKHELRPEFEQEINARLNEAMDETESERFLGVLRANSDETLLYFKKTMSALPDKRDLMWEQRMRTMLKVAGDAEFKAEQKTEVLDLLKQQLLNARMDQNGSVRQHTDEWFEEYLRCEPRMAQKMTMVDAYRERVIQASSEFQDGPETRQSPNAEP